MRYSKRYSINLLLTTLLFLSFLSFLQFTTIPTLQTNPDEEYLYVDGWLAETDQWTKAGTSPYIDEEGDGDYIDGAIPKTDAGYTFTDHSASGILSNVYLRARAYKIGTTGIVAYYIWDGVAYQSADSSSLTDSYAWYEKDVSSILNTWDKVDGAKLKLVSSGYSANVYVDVACLKVVYTIPSEPQFSNFGTNTTKASYSCEFQINCSDPQSDNLDWCGVSNNISGSWSANETVFNDAGVSEKWANITKLLDVSPKTVVGIRWYCNDTNGNMGDSGIQTITTSYSAPQFSNTGTNSTLIKSSIKFYAYCFDESLSGYIFGWNISGTLENDTWTDPWAGTPSSGWVNVTKVTDQRIGITLTAKIYANDTEDNWNATTIQIITSISSDGYYILRPNENGSIIQFDQYPASGENFDKVDEVDSDNDTTYVYRVSSGEELYGIDNPGCLDELGITVKNVTVYIVARRSGTSSPHIKIRLRTHSVTYEGSEITVLSTSYVIYNTSWTLNPNTSLSWTENEIVNLEVGQKIVQAGDLRVTQVYIKIYLETDFVFSNIGVSEVLPGYSSTFQCKAIHIFKLSHFLLGTNNTGLWVNGTWQPFTELSVIAWAQVTKTLNSTLGAYINYTFWINNTQGEISSIGYHGFWLWESYPTPREKSFGETQGACKGAQYVDGAVKAIYLGYQNSSFTPWHYHIAAYNVETRTWTEPYDFGEIGEYDQGYYGVMSCLPDGRLIFLRGHGCHPKYSISTYNTSVETDLDKLISNWDSTQSVSTPLSYHQYGFGSSAFALRWDDALLWFVRVGNMISNNTICVFKWNETAGDFNDAFVLFEPVNDVFCGVSKNMSLTMIALAGVNEMRAGFLYSPDKGDTWKFINGTTASIPVNVSDALAFQSDAGCVGYPITPLIDENNRTCFIALMKGASVPSRLVYYNKSLGEAGGSWIANIVTDTNGTQIRAVTFTFILDDFYGRPTFWRSIREYGDANKVVAKYVRSKNSTYEFHAVYKDDEAPTTMSCVYPVRDRPKNNYEVMCLESYGGVSTFKIRAGCMFSLDLQIKDWDQTDIVQGAKVYVDSAYEISDSNGWANFTNLEIYTNVSINVSYFGFPVNGSFSIYMDSNKISSVQTKTYDTVFHMRDKTNTTDIPDAKIQAFNSTNHLIKYGFTNSSGLVRLTNLPNGSMNVKAYDNSSTFLYAGYKTPTQDEAYFFIIASAAWSFIEQWYGTLAYPFMWRFIELWFGYLAESFVGWNFIELWFGVLNYIPVWHFVELWYGILSTLLPVWHFIEQWYGTLVYVALWRFIELWHGIITAPPIFWNFIELWYGTLSAPIPLWNFIELWFGTMSYVPPYWHFIELWAGFLNTPWWHSIEQWFGTLRAPFWQFIEQWFGLLYYPGYKPPFINPWFPEWQLLTEGNLAGFILSAFTSILGINIFYAIIVLIGTLALYLRTENLTYCTIVWALVGIFFMFVLPPFGLNLATVFMVLGLTVGLYRLFRSGKD